MENLMKERQENENIFKFKLIKVSYEFRFITASETYKAKEL